MKTIKNTIPPDIHRIATFVPFVPFNPSGTKAQVRIPFIPFGTGGKLIEPSFCRLILYGMRPHSYGQYTL
ncbi:unnamed protein product [Rhizophagus irregularis]|nr:unnamed protein product [Rhizophagus irregularis]